MEHTDTDSSSVTGGSAQSKCAEVTTKACGGEWGTTQYWETPFAKCYIYLFFFKPKLKRQHYTKPTHFALTFCR